MQAKPFTLSHGLHLRRLALLGADHRQWYDTARAQVTAAAVVLEVTPRRLADLLALFSPRVSVRRSIRFTVHYIQSQQTVCSVCGTDWTAGRVSCDCDCRAVPIRTGEFLPDVTRSVRASIAHYEKTGIIRGPKTSAFARAVLGDRDAIVLDTWMAVAFNIDQKRIATKAVHGACCKKLRRLAKSLGWSNAETQAAIWTGAVRAAGRNVPEFLIEPELSDISTAEQAADYLNAVDIPY